jgi:hypothetical protein
MYSYKLKHLFTESLTQHFLFLFLVLLTTKAAYTAITDFASWKQAMLGQQWNGIECSLPFTVACSERAVHLCCITHYSQPAKVTSHEYTNILCSVTFHETVTFSTLAIKPAHHELLSCLNTIAKNS